MTHPMAVTNCNIDMESLISDQNRSIATLAITTLLKTGNESSVDRLMKQITNFMSDIADEFKIVVVEAIRSLCLKFPLKYRALWVGYQIQFFFCFKMLGLRWLLVSLHVFLFVYTFSSNIPCLSFSTGWTFSATFSEKKVDLSTKRQLLIQLWFS